MHCQMVINNEKNILQDKSFLVGTYIIMNQIPLLKVKPYVIITKIIRKMYED